MSTRQLGFNAPVSLAVAASATSPVPGFPGVWIWSTVTNTPLYWNGSSWQAPQGSAPATFTYGAASIDFGSTLSDEVIVTVLAATVTANSFINLMIDPSGTTDHSQDEHAVEEFKLVPQNLVPGVSFDIRMICLDNFGFTGKWSIRWSLSN